MEYYWTTLFHNSNASTSTSSLQGQNRNFTPNHAWDLAADSTRVPADYATTQPMVQQGQNSTRPDPHLTCLKLGKRQYCFEDLTATKKGKAFPAPASECQVEGCQAVLLNAKDYHRRHKVCEMHAKAPKVVVLGIEQRFCQQCSRFHVVDEFDEAKRSCRRRLAGHNERRRKSSQEHMNSLARKHFHGGGGGGGQPQLVNNGECALSLLSPTNSTPDLPARCNAALRELIAENRASLNRGNVTLNLMRGPASAFALHNEEGDGDASHLWNPPFAYSPT